MLAFVTFLCFLLVLALGAIAVWLWLFVGIFEQVSQLIRIKVEEQIAVWRIESIARIAKLEQQKLHDDHSA